VRERANLDPEVHVIALSGRGPGFCGGYDLVESAEGAMGLGAPGAAAGSPFFRAIPWLVIGTFVLGLLGVLLLRSRNKTVYDSIGRSVFEEAHARDDGADVPSGGTSRR